MLSVPPDTLRLLQKGINGSHGRSPTNRSNAFRWSIGKSSPGFSAPREEREEYAVNESSDESVKSTDPKKHFIKVPENIQNFTDEQIDQWAADIYGQFMEYSKLDQFAQDRLYLQKFYEVFGVKSYIWPSTVQLADMLAAYFPGSQLSVEIGGDTYRFKLSYQGKLLATLDENEISFTTGEPTQEWIGIEEGDVFSIGEIYLQHFSDLGYKILKPFRPINFGVKVTTTALLEPTEKENT